jgi:hypothetical protein
LLDQNDGSAGTYILHIFLSELVSWSTHVLCSCTYGLLDSNTMVAAWTYNATEYLVLINLTTSKYLFIAAPVAALTGH